MSEIEEETKKKLYDLEVAMRRAQIELVKSKARKINAVASRIEAENRKTAMGGIA